MHNNIVTRVTMPCWMQEDLKAISRRTGESVASIVRRCVIERLNLVPPNPDEPNRGESSGE